MPAIDRRQFLGTVTFGATAARVRAHDAWNPQTRAPLTTPPRTALVFDALGELRMNYTPALVRDMLASGLDAIGVTLCDPKPAGAEAFQLAVDGVLDYDAYLAAHPEFYVKATAVADIDRAQRDGRMAVFYMYQNTTPLGRELKRLAFFYRLGVRSFQLTYNEANDVGAGCYATGRLTPFGREVVAAMNRQRILIDLSHANPDTMADAIAASGAPVIISHTACAAVHRHPRNTSDEHMRAVAARGGVVGICQMRPFLTTKKADNLPAYFDHVLHAIDVAGIEHVAIGSDRDHRVITITPEYLAELRREEGSQLLAEEMPLFIHELNGPRRMEVVWDGLVKRGLSSSQVERVMGRNLYRLYKDVIG